jgi:Transglycosylase SLT domain
MTRPHKGLGTVGVVVIMAATPILPILTSVYYNNTVKVEPVQHKFLKHHDYDREVVPSRSERRSISKVLAVSLAKDHWKDESNVEAFLEIIRRESCFDYLSVNKESGAYGLAQALPADKMSGTGHDYLTNPETQLRWMIKYIDLRYGNAKLALSFHNRNGWY